MYVDYHLVKVFTTSIALEALFDEAPEEFIAVVAKGRSSICVNDEAVLRNVDLVLGRFHLIKIFTPRIIISYKSDTNINYYIPYDS